MTTRLAFALVRRSGSASTDSSSLGHLVARHAGLAAALAGVVPPSAAREPPRNLCSPRSRGGPEPTGVPDQLPGDWRALQCLGQSSHLATNVGSAATFVPVCANHTLGARVGVGHRGAGPGGWTRIIGLRGTGRWATVVLADFGPYRLETLLGRGGMGEVFRAFDNDHGRLVALKRLAAHLADDPEFQGRFRREAPLAAKLRNPHIVPIHRFGELDGHLFFVLRPARRAHPRPSTTGRQGHTRRGGRGMIFGSDGTRGRCGIWLPTADGEPRV
jgi:Protein kinase domain